MAFKYNNNNLIQNFQLNHLLFFFSFIQIRIINFKEFLH